MTITAAEMRRELDRWSRDEHVAGRRSDEAHMRGDHVRGRREAQASRQAYGMTRHYERRLAEQGGGRRG